MPPRISVAICTHNRSPYLRKALLSVAQQTLQAHVYEVIVVDNASTDDTRRVVEGFDGLSNLTYVFEATLGLSRARNRALEVATGKFIAYLDDDAIASPAWLTSLLDTFESSPKLLGCVGGRIDPIWEKPCPAWLPPELIQYFTVLDCGPVRRELDLPRESVYGANMAFLRQAVQSVGGFDLSLGRVGSRMLSCEEIIVQRRLAASGYATCYDPNAVVAHHIIQTRVSPDWLAQRAFWQGVSEAAMNIRLTAMKPTARISSVMEPLARLLAGPLLRIGRSARYPKDAQKIYVRCRRMGLLGAIYGYLAFHSHAA
jgi:glycosyltransferase involved in cell wall biosynthesis